MKQKWGKRLGALLLVCAMVLTFVPAASAASGTVTVRYNGGTLSEGANSVGGGTVTVDSESSTVTMENVALEHYLSIAASDAVRLVVKGVNSVGDAEEPQNASNIVSTNALQVELTEGSSLSLYAKNANNVWVSNGTLEITGPGKLTGKADYPCIAAMGDITLNGAVDANVSNYTEGTYTNGVFSQTGDIFLDGVTLTVDVGGVGLFAETYDYNTDADIASAISLKNSSVNITSGDNAVFCGEGGIVVENTVLTTDVFAGTAEEEYEDGYFSLYTYGDIAISGDQTKIEAKDGAGIQADNVLTISGGNVRVVSTGGTALAGWNGLEITGGTIDASSQHQSAIFAREGALRITGDTTNVTATSASAEFAAVRTFRNGGTMELSAYVKATNTAGGKPFEAVSSAEGASITLGDKYEAIHESGEVEIYTKTGTDDKQKSDSYFITAGGGEADAVTGTVTVQKIDPLGRFTDIPADAWYRDVVADMVEQGILSGMSETIFAPEESLTRAELVTILAEAFATDEELEQAAEDGSPFTDSTNHWAKDYIAWAYAKGIISGVSATRFAPDAEISRQDLAAILGRYVIKAQLQLPDTEEPVDFTDQAQISSYAVNHVSELQQAGVLSGYTDGSFQPQNLTKRCEAASLFSRFFKAVAK